ncbi:hypothetical protein [Halosimplex halobium]|uniref:hypothetical protein n=1 Tax=Halosimplex halobium TaxID=3396618 RepID=UPI003F549255
MSWPLEIDGREYQPIPESWIEAGVDDGFGDPRLYAVSAAVESRQMLVVRYAHPSNPGVLWASMQGTDGSSGGTIPASLPRRSWPRSIVPGRNTEPTGVIRDIEREHLEELWADRLQEDDEADQQLIADGGRVDDDTERRVQELEERVRELEQIINRDLGYNLGKTPIEPQYVDCDCGETFEVDLINGLVCPECGRGSDERGESA